MQIDIKPLFNINKLGTQSKEAKLAIEKATVSTLNKLGQQGITKAARSITSKYNIKGKEVKKNLKLQRATRNNKTAYITVEGNRSISLYHFGGLPKAPVSQMGIKAPYKGRKRASVKVLKSGSRTKLNHAFVATMGGNTAIYERTTVRSFPVVKKMALGVPFMFKNEAVKAIDYLVISKGKELFDRECNYYLSKVKTR